MIRCKHFVIGLVLALYVLVSGCIQTHTSSRATISAFRRRLPAPSVQIASQETPRARPRVYAILVGISDYPGTRDDLRDCDTDAVRILQSLEARHLVAEGGVRLLVNQQATTQAVLEAFATLAPRVQEQDLFLFFFDGHGNRRDLSFYDDRLSRVDMRALLRLVPRGRRLVVLDSCEAGGFASAVEDLPNTAGLFAARHNENASIAPRLHAGGYLAFYLWRELVSYRTATSSDLLRAAEAGYETCRVRSQHPLLAGDRRLKLW